MIEIPEVLHVKISKNKTWTYDYMYSTEYLLVYKCRETGCIESFQKKDFTVKRNKNITVSKWERRT